ncbi:MAG TPA: hypothetical protein PKY59_22590 [Pyrinomonadaceae bacterium]|nr:hypothetical protein [Pyrinomonadaceae bacterium]
MMKEQKYLNFLGWFGGIVCLTGYGLITQKFLPSDSIIFLIMNFVGCICLIFYTFHKGAFANAALNSVHLLITILALSRLIFG